jgi:hypothetical protein
MKPSSSARAGTSTTDRSRLDVTGAAFLLAESADGVMAITAQRNTSLTGIHVGNAIDLAVVV